MGMGRKARRALDMCGQSVAIPRGVGNEGKGWDLTGTFRQQV